MKSVLVVVALFLGSASHAGTVGLPSEHVVLPVVTGDYWVCVWDEDAGDWHGEFVAYDGTGVFDFQVPQWDRRYWIGLWDAQAGHYVFGQWIGHFKTDGGR